MDGALRYLRASDFLHELRGNIALVKSDFNVTLSQGLVTNNFRIRQAAPFMKKLLEEGVVPLIATHLGRPEPPKKYYPTLDVLADSIYSAIGRRVDIIGFDPESRTYVDLTKERIHDAYYSGKVPMLENIRFHPDEVKNRGGLARILGEVADISIQNSFGTAHRKEDTSNHIHEFIPGLAGDLLVEEIEAHREIKKPNSPYVVIVGGDKVEDSLNLMRAILRAETTTHWSNMSDYSLNLQIGQKLVDYVLVGGHLMNAFIYAQLQMIDPPLLRKMSPELRKDFRGLQELRLEGYDNQNEHNKEEIRLAKGLLRLYNEYQFWDENPLNGRRLIVPVDYAVLRSGAKIPSVKLNELIDGNRIIDIGARTRKLYSQIVRQASTILWNGPMGVDDEEAKMIYAEGTNQISDSISANGAAVKEIGGGSTVDRVESYERTFGRQLNLRHRSTGGGSTILESAFDSPTTISLMMSYTRLLEGGYGPRYEALRKAAIMATISKTHQI